VFLGKDYAQPKDYSEELPPPFDPESHNPTPQAHDGPRLILTTHRDVLDRLAEELIENETLDQKEVARVFAPVGKWESAGNGTGRIQPPVTKPRDPAAALPDGGVAAASATESGLT